MGSKTDERPPIVSDLMSAPAICVLADTSVRDIAELLVNKRISAVPVVDRDNRLLGLVSEADVLMKEVIVVLGHGAVWFESSRTKRLRRLREAGTAAELMTTPAFSITPAATVREAARILHEKRIKRLPVVESGAVVGIISRADLLRVYLTPDALLQRRVARALEGWLDSGDPGVQVTVNRGQVTLMGRVIRHSTCDIVAMLVANIDGVAEVDNRVTWEKNDRLMDAVAKATF